MSVGQVVVVEYQGRCPRLEWVLHDEDVEYQRICTVQHLRDVGYQGGADD